MLTLGQGVYNNYAIIQGHYENPVDEVKCNIHSAISDKELQRSSPESKCLSDLIFQISRI